MFYLGIDQHAKQLTVSLRNEAGDVIHTRQVSTEPTKVAAYLSSVQKPAVDGYYAIVEVCGFNDWLLELLPKYGCSEVVLIQPDSKRRIKTDRRDAKQLSELLWMNRLRLQAKQSINGVRQVIMPTAENSAIQRMTLVRQQITRQRTKCINRIKHILRRHNLHWQMPTKTFPTKTAMTWLETLTLPTWDRHEMDMLLSDMKLHDKRIGELDLLLLDLCSDNYDVQLLITIPGISSFSALSLASRIGDATRFRNGRSMSNYFGLTPSVSDSGETKGRRGHITKAGSTFVRWILGQTVLHVLRKDSEMKRWYKSIRNRRGSKIARVAVMRRLCQIIRNILVDQQDYWTCRQEMLSRQKHTPNQPPKAAKASNGGPMLVS